MAIITSLCNSTRATSLFNRLPKQHRNSSCKHFLNKVRLCQFGCSICVWIAKLTQEWTKEKKEVKDFCKRKNIKTSNLGGVPGKYVLNICGKADCYR